MAVLKIYNDIVDEENKVYLSWDGFDGMTFSDVKKFLENIPADGTRYTFACNHPLGGIDGVALASLVGTAFGSVGALMNDFLHIRSICRKCDLNAFIVFVKIIIYQFS